MSNELLYVGPYDRLVDEYLDHVRKKGRTPDTVESYGYCLRVFKQWVFSQGPGSPFTATVDDIEYFKGYLKLRHAKSTTNTILSAVRVWYTWLLKQKNREGKPYILSNPAAAVESLPPSKLPLRDPFSERDIQRLLQTTEGTTDVQIRDRFLINLCLRNLLRQIECWRANLEDIRRLQNRNGEWAYWLSVWGKGRTSRDEEVVFMPETEEAFLAYLKVHPFAEEMKGPLFVTLGSNVKTKDMETRRLSREALYYAIRKRLNQIGITDRRLSPHSLRVTGATVAYLNGASPRDLLNLGRWGTWQTADLYAQKTDRRERPAERFVHFSFDGDQSGEDSP